MYLIIAIIIMVFIIYVFKNRVDNKAEEKADKSIPDEDTQPEKPKELILHFNTDAVKFSFYSFSVFKNYRTKKLYEKVVIDRLFIEEPFHTVFVQLIQIYEHTHSWLKSNKTKEIKLKVRKKNASFEEGISFKVYSISQIAFDFLENILQYLTLHKYSKEDEQIIILVTLLYKINNIKELQYLCPDCKEEIKFRDCIVKILLNKFDKKDSILFCLSMIEHGDEHLEFIIKIYKETIFFQEEYPFVLKEDKDIEKLSLTSLVNGKEKKLLPINAF